MAEHTPTTETVRDCFADGAAGEFIEEDFDRWLAAHDAELRAEVERLREGAGRALVDRDAYRAELDEARQQVADLRAGIEALAAEFEKPSPSTLAYKSEVVRAVRALLAGSGEQPGADHTAELSDGTPPTLPPVEDVARLLYERFSQNRLVTWDVLGDVDDGPGSTREWYRDRAREVLALFEKGKGRG